MTRNSSVRTAPSLIPAALRDTTPTLGELQQTLSALLEKHLDLENQNHQLHRLCTVLEQSRTQYEELYNHAPTGYAILSADGDIQNINLTGARILREQQSHLIGKSFYAFLADFDKETFLYHLAQCREHYRHVTTVHLAHHTQAATLHVVSTAAQENTSPNISFRTVLLDTTPQQLQPSLSLPSTPAAHAPSGAQPQSQVHPPLSHLSLEQELEQKNRDLTMLSLQYLEKQEQFAALEQQLKKASWVSPSQSRQLIQTMLHTVRESLQQQGMWQQAEQHISNDTRTFLTTLARNYPELTSSELKICNLIRLTMSTKEISSILHTSPKTIENQRYRIRKKLGLSSKQHLVSFLMAL